MKYNLAPIVVIAFGPFLIGSIYTVGYQNGHKSASDAVQVDPELDKCAEKANVYRCAYVAQPVSSTLLPPPDGGV